MVPQSSVNTTGVSRRLRARRSAVVENTWCNAPNPVSALNVERGPILRVLSSPFS